ncbi:putative lipoprotein, partial [Burkholderia multivorans CF2]
MMTSGRFRPHARPRALGLLAALLVSAAMLAACGGDEPGAS